MHVSWSGGRAHYFFYISALLPFSFNGAGAADGVFGGSLHSTAGLWVYKSAVREGERAELFFYLRFHRKIFPERGPGFSANLYTRRRRFWYAYQRVGRVSAPFFFYLRFRRSTFRERGARDGVFGGYLYSAAALLVCMPVGREGERSGSFIFELPLFNFLGSGWGKGVGGLWRLSTLSDGAFDICMPKTSARCPFFCATTFAFVYSYACKSRVIQVKSYSYPRVRFPTGPWQRPAGAVISTIVQTHRRKEPQWLRVCNIFDA